MQAENRLEYLKKLLDMLPSDYYDNSPIPNETEMCKKITILEAEDYNLVEDAITIIETNPGITLDDFMLAFDNYTPALENDNDHDECKSE